MTPFLNVDLVQYRCSCGLWSPANRLYFCRRCSKVICTVCIYEEVEIVYCPRCMESSRSGSRKFRCDTCASCPKCANTLKVICTGTFYYAYCPSCHWTSRDAQIPDQQHELFVWPEHENPVRQQLDQVTKFIKQIAMNEKNERDREKNDKALSSLGILLNDRFALNTAYNMRQRALSRSKVPPPDVNIEPTSDVPELDPSVFTEPVRVDETPTLEQILRQPLCGRDQPLYPQKVALNSRRIVRCNEDRTLLYRCETNCSTVTHKVAYFLLHSVPEVRIYRPVQFAVEQEFSVFLTVSNQTPAPMKAVLRADDAPVGDATRHVDCSGFKVSLVITNPKTTKIDELQHPSKPVPENDDAPVLMITCDRYRVRVDCKPLGVDLPAAGSDSAPYLPLVLSCNNPDETPDKWVDVHVRVFLDSRVRAAER